MSKKDKDKQKHEKVKIGSFRDLDLSELGRSLTAERFGLNAASEAAIEIARLADLVDELHEENTALRSENGYLTNEASDLRGTVAFRNQQLTNIRAENTDLKLKLEEQGAESFVKSFVQKDQPQYAMSIEPDEVMDLRIQVNRLREEKYGLERRTQDLQEQVEDLMANVNDRERTCFTADQVIALIDARGETA